MTPRYLVAFDMDGTLLDSHRHLPEGFKPWVLSHPQFQVVIASGRQYEKLLRDFADIQDRIVFICENGAFVTYRGKTLSESRLPKDDVHLIKDIYEQHPDVNGILCSAHAAYIRTNESLYREAAHFYGVLKQVEDTDAIIDSQPIIKVAIYSHDSKVSQSYYRNLPSHLKPVISGREWIDVALRDANKGNAYRIVQNAFSISRENSYAFGDQFNDEELLLACEESYCMKNGADGMKAIAKHVTEYTNDENGVLRELEKIVNQKEL